MRAVSSRPRRLRKATWTAVGGTLLVAVATLISGSGTSYGTTSGGSDHTTTYTTTTTATAAETSVAREYDFGPVWESEPSANCQVTIDWGDGSSSPASLGESGKEAGEREVTATHTYATAGAYEATQEAVPSEKCTLGTRTVTEIIVGGFMLGTNTNYTATIFQVTVTDPTSAKSTSTSSSEPAPASSGESPPPEPTAAPAAQTTQTQTAQTVEPPASLCGTSNLFDLIDVYPAHGKAYLVGYADPRLAGQTVKIVASWSHKLVATTTIGSDGYFNATAKLPPRRVRNTNSARFQAQDGSYRSARLKLTRRMYLYQLTPTTGNRVKLAGVVVRPLTKPAASITVYRRDNCKQRGYVRIKARVTLNPRTGRFTVLAEAPPSGATGAVYRLATKVREAASRRAAHTFTLPRTLLSA